MLGRDGDLVWLTRVPSRIEPWRMVAEDVSQESPHLFSVVPGHLDARS